ncbi:hypothetical protein QBC47DRAFT_403567 [Echria macrotheca]|uniref:Uncharacterized protein n=1 Tax=Echria macrotheca TaxID=438768 RepID=A0AAJ0B9I3_9PEZI|nr:hypothetical protein QBC47DRAFT_403567 [Echria macrotheca]
MPTATSPKILMSRIPNIKTLREELGYGDPKQRRYSVFCEYTSLFQKIYRTGSGIGGLELHNWKSDITQAGLDDMTAAFLEDEGNGWLFWPDERSSTYYNTLQYSEHSMKITRLMKQLFFRMSLQNYRNRKYKGKRADELTVDGSEFHQKSAVSLDECQDIERAEGQVATTSTPSTTLETIHLNSDGQETIINDPLSELAPTFVQPKTQKRRGDDETSPQHGNKRHKIIHNTEPHPPHNLAAYSGAMEQGQTIIVRVVDNPISQVNSTTADSSISSDPHFSCQDNRTPLGPIIISRDESGRSECETKPCVKFIYRVVLSHPRRVTKRWYPQGNFKDKSLGDLLKEVPLAHDNVEGFTFAFENPHMRMVEYIPKHDVDGFESMKRFVDRLVKELLQIQVREGAKDPRLVTDVLIEAGDGRDNDLYDRMEETSLEW